MDRLAKRLDRLERDSAGDKSQVLGRYVRTGEWRGPDPVVAEAKELLAFMEHVAKMMGDPPERVRAAIERW